MGALYSGARFRRPVRGMSAFRREHSDMGPLAGATRRANSQYLGERCRALGRAQPRFSVVRSILGPGVRVLSALVVAGVVGACISSGNDSIADATNATVAGQLLKG